MGPRPCNGHTLNNNTYPIRSTTRRQGRSERPLSSVITILVHDVQNRKNVQIFCRRIFGKVRRQATSKKKKRRFASLLRSFLPSFIRLVTKKKETDSESDSNSNNKEEEEEEEEKKEFIIISTVRENATQSFVVVLRK